MLEIDVFPCFLSNMQFFWHLFWSSVILWDFVAVEKSTEKGDPGVLTTENINLSKRGLDREHDIGDCYHCNYESA